MKKNSLFRLFSCSLLTCLLGPGIGIKAQDYQISFSGSGESTTVATVNVENITKGTSVSLTGTDVLHLMKTITGIESMGQNSVKKLTFTPNPMSGNSVMQFDLPRSGLTNISFHDLSGKNVLSREDNLHDGRHRYDIAGLDPGLYVVTISGGGYSFSGRLLNIGSNGGSASITYNNSKIINDKSSASKGNCEEIMMQYDTGDILKFTAASGDYTTVFTYVPNASSTITFNFTRCTDFEGNNYSVVQIGTQTWMAENLKSTKFNDGTVIPNVTGDFDWMILSTPSYSWYNHNITNKNIYGALYNSFTVHTGKLCPIGWHVPTDAEWTALINFVGGEDVAGRKLKETGTVHWRNPNTATNDFGFTGLPGGAREYDGVFQTQTLGTVGYWWSSTVASGTDFPWIRIMVNDWSNSARNYVPANVGLSIRCIKN